MAAVVGRFIYNGIQGEMTMRSMGSVVRIALDLGQVAINDNIRNLIEELKKLTISTRTEVFDIETPETRFLILAGDRFGDSVYVPSALNEKFTIENADKILNGLKVAVPGLEFQKLEAYAYL